MPTFTAFDGTRLAYHVAGVGEPLICLPGGPMRASAYLGDLGGLTAHRTLIRLDLRGTGDSAVPANPASYRCDRQIADVEALRARLGLDRMDLLAHSAAGDLGIGYAARHPGRVRSLTLVTPGADALGVEYTAEQRREAAALRAGEPWFAAAFPAFEAAVEGRATAADWAAVAPFAYGRWDAAAQAHAASGATQRNREAAAVYVDDDAFDPEAVRAAVRGLDAPVLVYAGELDGGPVPEAAGAVARLFPRADVAVQPGAAHFPWLDDPAAFAGTVAAFLTRH